MATGNILRDYLTEVQSGTRSQPISPALATVLQRAAQQAGVTVRVYSGGQPARGEGGARTGSTRHDHGNAADLYVYQNGRRLDFNNPTDVPALQAFVRAAVANGATGIGAGNGYMGPGIHVGFGPNGQTGGPVTIWGAKGRSANAAPFLGEAVSGMVAPSQVAMANVPMPNMRLGVLTSAKQNNAMMAFAAPGAVNEAPFDAVMSGTGVPMPNLRPRSAIASGPTPPLPIPEANPAAVTVPPGPLGADRVLSAVLRKDAAGIRNAFAAILSSPDLLKTDASGVRGADRVSAYFKGINTAQPAVASQVATIMASNPAMWNSIPEKHYWNPVRGPIRSGLNQVPTTPSPELTGKKYDALTGQYRDPVTRVTPRAVKAPAPLPVAKSAPIPTGPRVDTTSISQYRPMVAPPKPAPASAPSYATGIAGYRPMVAAPKSMVASTIKMAAPAVAPINRAAANTSKAGLNISKTPIKMVAPAPQRVPVATPRPILVAAPAYAPVAPVAAPQGLYGLPPPPVVSPKPKVNPLAPTPRQLAAPTSNGSSPTYTYNQNTNSFGYY